MSRTTLRVFEHETVRLGQRTRCGDLVPSSLDIDALARFNDANDQRFFHLGYRSLKFKQYVGYVQIGDVAFEVLPKADRARDVDASDGKRWKRALIGMLEIATGMTLYSPTDASQQVDKSSLLDLLVAAFAAEVGGLLREGLARAYRTEESNSTAFRGRLMVAENIRHNLVRGDRFFVRYATFSRDVVVNQLVGEALRVACELPISATLRARCEDHRSHFVDLSPLRAPATYFDRVVLGRSTARYEKALRLARMIVEQVTPSLEHGKSEVFAFLFDMNVLWETYVASLFHRATVPGLVVKTQSRRVFWQSDARAKKMLRPDILVEREGQTVLIVDTKWKVNDGSPPDDGDLKQIFAYNELFGCKESVLLYPSRGADTASSRGRFQVDAKHACRTESLGLFDGTGLATKAMISAIKSLLVGAVADPTWQ